MSTGEIKSDQVSDQLHQIQKAQSQAHRIIVQNEQHEHSLRQAIPSVHGNFKLHNRVWVRLFDKHSQNPKLDPTFKPGVIVDQKTASTFKVNRLERSRRKTITLNQTLFKKRHSEHPMDFRLIPAAHYKPAVTIKHEDCLLYTSPSPRDRG